MPFRSCFVFSANYLSLFASTVSNKVKSIFGAGNSIYFYTKVIKNCVYIIQLCYFCFILLTLFVPIASLYFVFSFACSLPIVFENCEKLCFKYTNVVDISLASFVC